ncbi:MAG: hypothetical protein KME03_20075 [Aphanocapsa lilacina HA4352-LM1]|nr:hypothetical protein [Aphanocapsa lilacina HA4352-LM1]
MYSIHRLQFLRNMLVSTATGLVTLVILLIAPLGLAAVITCTLAVTLASFCIGAVSDRVLAWLETGQARQMLERR